MTAGALYVAPGDAVDWAYGMVTTYFRSVLN